MIVVEPIGAISFAALDYYKEEIKGKHVVIIVCGGNNDITPHGRYERERYCGKAGNITLSSVFLKAAGKLRDFLNLLGPDVMTCKQP
ncbi:MAG: hypothetical protein IPJ13_00155 [Saprospiraceae bacterium]|nr:hypothetical protein [Saprospiraceae bacterium]